MNKNYLIILGIITLLIVGGVLLFRKSGPTQQTTPFPKTAERPIFPTRPPDPFFDTDNTAQVAVVKGFISSVKGNNVTIINTKNKSQSFPVDPAVQISFKGSNKTGNGQQAVISGKQAIVSFTVTQGIYQIARILYLN